MSRKVELSPNDRSVYEEEIRPVLPGRIFDAHCHLLMNRFHPRIAETLPLALEPLLGDVDAPWLEDWWRTLFPGIEVSGMLMGYPTVDVDEAGENAFVAASACERHFPFALLVRPQTTAVALEDQILLHRPKVLKPYLVFVTNTSPAQARITDLLPEEHFALADKYRLAVMLHVSKPRGMADEENLADITRLIRDYPNCRFILAHCGRCFISPNMEAMLAKLPVADNLWLDTSAVCDPRVFLSLLSRYDRSRIMFGSDLVTAAAFRGTYVRLGMSWHVCTEAMVNRPGGLPAKSTFAAYENLSALCYAVQFLKFNQQERDALFCETAVSLYSGCGAWETP